ncbi:MAG: type II secretion system protein GspM [Burkholderiaceae bacterium]
MNALKHWWNGLAAREQSMLSVAAVVIGLALLWLVAMAPALQTLRTAQAQHAQVDAQLQSMQALAAQAKVLRTQRSLSNEESQRNLESSVKQTFGANASLAVNDGRANLTLKGVNPDALALWLSQARINARVVPSEARLLRSAIKPATPPAALAVASTATTAAAVSTPAVSPVLWDGVLVLALPGR